MNTIPLRRLLVQKTVDSTGECIAKYTYTIGKNGERTGILEEGLAGRTETEYTYDNAGRLTGEEIVTVESGSAEEATEKAASKVSYRYEYDKVGNRVSKSVDDGASTVTTKYTYNRRNQLTTETVRGQETIYSYDANGNLVKKSGVAGNESYQYDVYNRLVKYSLDDGSKAESYTYDAEGVRRSKMTTGGEETKEIFFVSDTSNELSRTVVETDEAGNVVATYSWGDTLLGQTREDMTSTYLYDGHGNVRGLLDEKGSLTDTYAYNAYGELTERTGETENHYLYTGEYYDGTTNLYYLRARYMNPSTGTFISMDTYQGDMYEPVSLHKYLYVNGNPVKYSDPSGNVPSLSETSAVNAIRATLYENRFMIMGMSIMNGIASGVMEAFTTNASLGSVTKAALKGMVLGAGMGAIYCLLAVITATSVASVFMSVVKLDTIVSAAIAIYSVLTGDFENALKYGLFFVIGVLGLAKWYNLNCRATYVGDKGNVSFWAKNRITSVNPNEIRFSQSSVNGAKEIIESMKTNGWKGEAIDVVIMPDNKLTTIDNTRVLAARYTEIKVEANLHAFTETLPKYLVERFTTPKGTPSTWGDAIILRIAKQNSGYRNKYPLGSNITGWKGN